MSQTSKNVKSQIDTLPESEIAELLNINKSVDVLHSAWDKYKISPGNSEAEDLMMAYTAFCKLNTGERDHELFIICNELLNMWIETKLPQHLQILTDLHPGSSDDAILCTILKIMRRPAKGSLSAIPKLKAKAEQKTLLNLRIAKRVITYPVAKPVAMINKIRKNLWRKTKNLIIIRPLRRKGYSDYMARSWVGSIKVDLYGEKEYSLREKIWSFRRGFRPWRIPQYDITKENYREFLSDRDYCYLHPINNSFVKWINDKVTTRYVLEPFRDHIPEYYFHILSRWGNIKDVVPLVDCPDGYESNYDGILRLLRDKGDLAYKKSSGAHGIGFKKLSYRNGVYFMNNIPCHINDIVRLFDSATVFYAITEYIRMHDDIKAIYPESVNTIRVMTINENGISPVVCDAYMRIGSESTGMTDNVGFGGVSASINLKTGHFFGGEQVIDHVITECPTHPDTGELIEGTVPHWDMVKSKLVEICKFMPQLEYLGFDIAITEKGFMVVEINVHQDLHRYPRYSEEVRDYFMRKLEDKRKRNKYRYKLI